MKNQNFKIGRGDIQWIVTFAYILTVAVGMLFTHKKYSEFGIDIFEYADVFDFLIAPFSDYKIVLFSISTLMIIWFVLKFDTYIKTKFPKLYSRSYFGIDKKNWFHFFRFFLFLFLLVFYLNISANFYGRLLKTEITSKKPVEVTFYDNSKARGIFIGKTKEVLFLIENKKIKVIPLAAMVKEYEVK